MSKRSRHRGEQPRATRTSPPAALGSSAGAMLAAWAWLLVYLLAFLRTPLSAAPGSAAESSRFDYFCTLALRFDDLLLDWCSGFNWASLAERGIILAASAAILAFALAAGWVFLRLLRVDRALSRVEMSLFSMAAGLNLVSLATLALGLAGWLARGAFLALALVTCVIAGTVYFRAGCASGTRGTETHDDAQRVLNPRWLWAAAPFAVALVLSAMLPPGDFDVREYHLQTPKEFYLAGQITFLPHNVYANMPLGAEMLALLGMVTVGDWWLGALVGKTLIALVAPLTAVALWAAGRRFASPSAGVVAALVYLSIPWVAAVSAQGLVDAVFAFYLFAALYAALIWHRGGRDTEPAEQPPAPRAGLLVLCGFLSGAAVATKYPAVVYSVLPLVVLVGYGEFSRTRRLASVAKPLAVFLLAVSLGGGLWLVKNAVLTGNPVYPLLYGVFDGATRTAEKNARWEQAHRPPNFAPRDLAERVWSATLASDWLSPLLIPLAALAIFDRRDRRLALLAGAYLAFVFAAWWLLTHRIERFLVPALPLAALLAGLGATWSASLAWRRTLATFLAIGLAYNLLLFTGGAVADIRYLADLNLLRVDARRVAPWHLYFNEHAAEITGLLLVGDAQAFDLDAPAYYSTAFDDSPFDALARDRQPEEIRAALQKRGISHIYVAWDEIARYRSPGNYGYSDLVQPRLFDDLVSAGVLQRLPALTGQSGQAFRVLPAAPR